MSKLVFMFPGQSSRSSDMISKLAALSGHNTALISRASKVLGKNLLDHFTVGSGCEFATNRDIQVGVFLANHLFLKSLEDEGVTASFSLGLSLGEYNHLVHIGALSFEDALLLVDQRGKLYDEGPSGMMMSVSPISFEEITDVVNQARESDILEISNLNSPSQFVIAGDAAAIARAQKLLEDLFLEGVIIENKIPMHCLRFKPVSDRLHHELTAMPWKSAVLPYLPNVSAELEWNSQAESYVRNLTHHVYQPVLWSQSIERILKEKPDAVFVEVGPRAVLFNLMGKKWRSFNRFKCDSADDFPVHFQNVLKELKTIGASL